MKKILLGLSILLLSYLADAQALTKDKVPVSVSKAFSTKYPLAMQESWQLEDPNTYKVEFINAKLNHTASFDKTGNG